MTKEMLKAERAEGAALTAIMEGVTCRQEQYQLRFAFNKAVNANLYKGVKLIAAFNAAKEEILAARG